MTLTYTIQYNRVILYTVIGKINFIVWYIYNNVLLIVFEFRFKLNPYLQFHDDTVFLLCIHILPRRPGIFGAIHFAHRAGTHRRIWRRCKNNDGYFFIGVDICAGTYVQLRAHCFIVGFSHHPHFAYGDVILRGEILFLAFSKPRSGKELRKRASRIRI